MARVDVSGIREARLAATALRAVEPDLRKAVNKSTREVVNPVWREAIETRARRRLDDVVLRRGARVATGTRPALVAASSRKAMSGGLIPADDWPVIEFGGRRGVTTTYTRRSRNGGTHRVTRHTRRQLPERTPGGRVLYPALAEALPRVASLWSQTAVRLVFEALRRGE